MNIFKTFLIVLFLIATVGIVLTKPTIHKAAMLENTNFTLESLNTPQVVVKSDFKELLPPSEKQIVTKDVPVKQVQVPTQAQTVKNIQQPVQKTVQTVKTQTVEPKKNVQPQVVDRIVKHLEEQPKDIEIQKPPKQEIVEKPVSLLTQEPPKIITKPVTINTTPLTEKEEIIAWNKWRSDLQNQVMKDSRINAPVGTTFHFSCTVDKFGNISNINTWSDNDYYTPLAKRVIKPVLSSYQNLQILKFPERTKRTITNVTGSFTMSYSNRFSTPADYSDYERIK